ncbi:MAG: hypothetical protein QQN41_11265 [Nitrosopumilus sp.]
MSLDEKIFKVKNNALSYDLRLDVTDVKQFVKELMENEDIIDKVKDWMQCFEKENKIYPSYLVIVLKCVELFESKLKELAGKGLI